MVPRAGLTADRPTEAAADLADEIGFEHVTLAALARRFGVKDASLYAHVRNLQDLRTRVALLSGGEMIDRIAVAVAGRAGKDALVAFAGAYRAYALERPGRYAATQIRISPTRYACCAPPSTVTAPWSRRAGSAPPATYRSPGTGRSTPCT